MVAVHFFEWNLDELPHLNCDDKPVQDRNRLDLVTIAFNNDLVIAHQIRLLRKYLQDPYYFTVIDNSTDQQKQGTIMDLCQENNTSYIRLPKLPRSFLPMTPNISHGLALCWAYRNYLSRRKAKYFGFLDHDVFPIRPTKIIEILNNADIYGLEQSRVLAEGPIWYLWPGFCFYRFDYVRDLKLNFMPRWGADVGSGNWKPLYSNYDKNKLPWVRFAYVKVREVPNEAMPDNFVEEIGDWLHTCNGSNWKSAPDKNDLVNELLNKY